MDIISQFGLIFMIMALIFGFYMTWGIGANDVANAMGTSVGSGAITVTTAILIAGVFEFTGAVVAGGNVTKTIRKGIIDPTPLVNSPEILIYGMLASLLAAGVWLAVASNRGWPVSTTHSIIGALVGFALASIGMEAVQWQKIGQIVASWVISPVLGGTLAFLIMTSIRTLILNTDHPVESAKRWSPIYLFLLGFVISLITLFKGLKHLNIDLSVPFSLLIATVFGTLVSIAGWFLISRVKIAASADRDYHLPMLRRSSLR